MGLKGLGVHRAGVRLGALRLGSGSRDWSPESRLMGPFWGGSSETRVLKSWEVLQGTGS